MRDGYFSGVQVDDLWVAFSLCADLFAASKIQVSSEVEEESKGASTTYLSLQEACPNFLKVLGLSLSKNSNSGALFASPLIRCPPTMEKWSFLSKSFSLWAYMKINEPFFSKEVEANQFPASSNTTSHLSSSAFRVPSNSTSLEVGISHIRKTQSKQTKAELLSLGETFQF